MLFYFLQTLSEPNQDLPNCSDKVQRNQLPTSFAKYITRAEDTFSSAGGELCAALDSDVSIIVDSDTIPVGIEQPVFFGVIYNETALLRDVPKTPDEMLISPVIECGPHDIELLKPVKIIIPHCLDLVEAKKEWINVYRCGQLPDNENGMFIIIILTHFFNVKLRLESLHHSACSQHLLLIATDRSLVM